MLGAILRHMHLITIIFTLHIHEKFGILYKQQSSSNSELLNLFFSLKINFAH